MSSSSDDSQNSEVSTPDSEEDLKREVNIVLNSIKNLPKKWRPSSAQVVIGIVHRENLKLLSGSLRRDNSGFFSSWKTQVLTSSFGGLQQTIRKPKPTGHHKSLVLLVTPLASEIEFHIPAHFRSLTLVCCADKRYTGSFLAIYPLSTYCSVRISDWDLRQECLRHGLHLGSGICLEDRFAPLFMRSSTPIDSDVSIIRNLAQRLRNKGLSGSQRKAIVASILGVLVGGGAAVKIYNCVRIATAGIFLTCKGSKWGPHSIKIAELAFGESYSSAASFAAAATNGPPILLGPVSGAVVGSLVYYLSWDKLFQWLRGAADGFWDWLIEIFQALRDAVASWSKQIKKRTRRTSHGSYHRTSRASVH